jgi:murein DD-endopeptidase MepM/ murein hydrolase activator NlpD
MAQGQLNAGSLGGRFLRRTFPQKVKPVPSRIGEHEEMMAQAKQAIPETNRRVRTSAAMIGLAISMGAYSLPISGQGADAVAAEPIPGEPAPSASSDAFEAVVVSQNSEAIAYADSGSDRKVSHTVQEGQTLWDVARFYQTNVTLVASANRLSVDAVLRVGQVLIVPTDTRLAQAAGDSTSSSTSPSYYGPISGRSQIPDDSSVVVQSNENESDSDTLKDKQHKALENLKKKTQSLHSGLSSLNSKKSKAVQQAPQIEEQVAVVSTLPVDSVSQPQQVLPSKPLVSSDNQRVAFRSPVSTQLSDPSTQVGQASSYQIAPGDTLAAIARAHNISVKQLAESNRISDPNYIFVNQTLIIPPSQNPVAEQSKYKGSIASVPVSSTVASASYTTPLPTAAAPITSAPMPVAAPFSNTNPVQPASESESRLVRYNQVENLRQEIDQLRQRYQAQPARSQTVFPEKPQASVSANSYAAAVSDRVNPEFNSDRSATLRTQLREMRSRVKAESASVIKPAPQQSTSLPVQQRSQLVAAAPLGSESYDPLLQAKLGQAVSPELPSIGTSEAYLPSTGERLAGFIWPTKGVLTSGFGWRWGRMHRGIDVAGPVGTPIVAAADGVVITAGWNSGGYGYLVEIQHPDGSMTLYAHNNRILVQKGQQVSQGQQISEMGSTGYSTGPHLHFEVHPAGKGAVNPMAYLSRS